jgi:formylglycine-generating enzyme required for sulfatase activity
VTLAANTEIPINQSPTAGQVLPPGTNMVQIPAGTYTVGKDPADDSHAPQQTVQLPSFWIDQYPTINADYQKYLGANSGAPIPARWPYKPGEEKHPVRGVTWDQANAYCQSINKRLPKEAEWEAAGRGTSNDPNKPPPLYPWGDSPNADGKTVDLPSDTYEVDKFDFNRSPFNLYDMLGNVFEWVGDSYTSDLPAGNRILHGSYGVTYDLAFRVKTAPDNPTYLYYAGFRCAADAVKQ